MSAAAPCGLSRFSQNHAVELGIAGVVQDETNFERRRPQIAVSLAAGDAHTRELGLVLDDDGVVDDHVDHLPSERFAAKVDHNGNLACDLVPFSDERDFQCLRVNVLAVTVAGLSANVEEVADDGACKLLVDETGHDIAWRASPERA
jgi:hypothetical protein